MPSSTHFTPIFNKVGGDVWTQWDKHLQVQVEAGKSPGSVENDVLLMGSNVKMMRTMIAAGNQLLTSMCLGLSSWTRMGIPPSLSSTTNLSLTSRTL